MQEVRYDSTPALRRPRRMLQSMLGDLKPAQELAWRLFLRDLKAKYRASILGYIWVLLPPVAITATFLLLQKARVMNVSELPVPYALYVLAGTTFWQLFADAVQTPLKIATQAKGMLTKINFPREALIGAAALESLFTFSIRFALLLICLPLFDLSVSTQILLHIPFGVFGLLIAGLSIGILITPFGILFQDFSQGLPIFLSLWMIATPIAYPPGQATGILEAINRYNPISTLIEWPKSAALSTDFAGLQAWGAIVAVTLLLCVSAWALFRIALPHIISRIGS